MGAKTWMLVYSTEEVPASFKDTPRLDRDRTFQLATSLFPKDKLELLGDGDLSYTCPPRGEVHAGYFPTVSMVAAKDFALDFPSKLPAEFIAHGDTGTMYLHAMHSAVDWLAFAKWSNGKLIRSLSLSPDSGILEDVGEHLPFEEPFWSGRHLVDDGYPLPFHPLELGEETLKHLFGYQLEGSIDPGSFQPEFVPLLRYRRTRPWWKPW